VGNHPGLSGPLHEFASLWLSEFLLFSTCPFIQKTGRPEPGMHEAMFGPWRRASSERELAGAASCATVKALASNG
jgi:hypothetical protein